MNTRLSLALVVLLGLSGASLGSILTPLSSASNPVTPVLTSAAQAVPLNPNLPLGTAIQIQNLIFRVLTHLNSSNLVQLYNVSPEGLQTTMANIDQSLVGSKKIVSEDANTQTVCLSLAGTMENALNMNYSNPQATTDSIVSINNGGTTETNSLGTMAVPTYTLCDLGEVYQLTMCYICNQDCYVAHNAFGGKCGPSTVNNQSTCLCSESAAEAQERNTVPDSSVTCQVGTTAIGPLTDLVFELVFRVRLFVLQCPQNAEMEFISQQGCIDDCVDNHGASGGMCTYEVPSVPRNIVYNQDPQVFCRCSYNSSAAANTTAGNSTTPSGY